LFIADKLKLFAAGKIDEDKFKAFCYGIRLIADLLKNDNDKRLDELEKILEEIKAEKVRV
jgi:hypothetical protein